MSNACGVVTSWIRCRPMNSCVCPLGILRTVWRSQTFWRSVEGMGNGTTVGESAVGGRRSAVGGRRSAVGGRRSGRNKAEPSLPEPKEEALSRSIRVVCCSFFNVWVCSPKQSLTREDRVAKIKTFRELDVWNCSMSLVLLCYHLSDSLPRQERYGLTGAASARGSIHTREYR